MNLSPAYLFTGSTQLLEQETFTFLRTIFCKNNSCLECTTCKQITEKQHHGTLWITPEKRYSIDDLDLIFKTTTLQLDADQHCFFIITKADTLNPTCANSLLKIVEEPPQGYHFIFLAERPAQLLPTIKSRCIQKKFSHLQHQEEIPAVVKPFMKFEIGDPVQFTKDVSSCTMTEQECMFWVDYLLQYWITTHKRMLHNHNTIQQAASLKMIELCKNQLNQPPGMGSAKLFWKNLYLQK